ncbi:MAG TPA: hypothetical protein VF599_01775 [Pyrinomonadaceae bacterium]
MNSIFNGFVIVVSVSLGSWALSLVVDTRGNLKGDVSYSKMDVSAGRTISFDTNNRTTTDYVAVGIPGGEIITTSKGRIIVNALVSGDIYKKGFFRVSGAIKKPVYDNFPQRKELKLSPTTIYGKSLKSRNITFENLIRNRAQITSSPEIDKIDVLPSKTKKTSLNKNSDKVAKSFGNFDDKWLTSGK